MPKPTRKQPEKINPAVALELWATGKSLDEIAAKYPGTSRRSVSRAVARALKAL